MSLLAFLGLLGSFGDLAADLLLDYLLDDSDSNGLPHVTHSEASERGIFIEGLHTHRFAGDHVNHAGITRLDRSRRFLERFTRTTIHLGQNGLELAGNVCSVAIEDRGVTLADVTRMVKNDDLSLKAFTALWRVILGIASHIASSDFFDRHVLDIEANVVSRLGLWKALVVHLHRFNLGGDVARSEVDHNTRLQDTSLDTTDRHSSNTSNLVDILERKSEGLLGRSRRRLNTVEGLVQSFTSDRGFVFLGGEALKPGSFIRCLDHVVTMPARDGQDGYSLGVVTNLLDIGLNFFLDLGETRLAVRWLGVVYLVDANDELLHTQGESKKGMLSGLAVLRNTSLKLTSTAGNNEHSTVGLRGTSNHVLDEITMARGIDDGNHVFFCLKLPQGNINGDTTLSLGLELVQNPGVFEGTFSHLLSFLLEFLDGSLVNTSTFVDEMASSGRFSRVDMTNDDNVDVDLFLFFGGHCF